MNLARNIVSSLGIAEPDNVTIYFYPHMLKLAEETAEECFKKGADVLLNLYTDRFYEAYLTHLSEESLKQPSDFCRALTETSTVEILIGAAYDPSFLKDIQPAKLAATNEGENKAHYPPQRKRSIRSAVVHMGSVTKPRAEGFGLDYVKWRRMVEQASLVDAKILSRTGRRLASALNGGEKVVLTGPEGTRLECSLKNRVAVVDDGVIDQRDLRKGFADTEVPSGKVTIAPNETTAEGKVIFNLPILFRGQMIRRLEWKFRHGRVMSFDGDSSATALREMWKKAAGDKERIASLTVGINPKAELGFSLNSIAAGAVSVAIGENQHLKGKNRSTFRCQGTIGNASLMVDDRILVEAGKIVQ